eukprot:449520-Prymnesium_polylepis.1
MHQSEGCAASVDDLEAANDGGTVTNRGEEDEQQHRAHEHNCSGSHVTTCVAARVQLVKESGPSHSARGSGMCAREVLGTG